MKSLRYTSLAKAVAKNTHRQRHHEQPGEDCKGRQKASKRGDRNDVAITDGPKRHDRPPQGSRNRSKPVGLRRAFGEVHQCRRYERRAEQNDEATGQRAPLGIQGVQQ
jgi:hypothetical protein